MKNRATFQVVVFLMLICSGFAIAEDHYWVSVGEDGDGDVTLLEINELGQVLVPPTAVLHSNDIGGGEALTAIANPAANLLDLYVLEFGISGSNQHRVFRARIDTKNLSVTSLTPTNLVTFGEAYLQVSQGSRKFLVFETKGPRVKAYGLNSSNGLPDGTSWRLNPRTDIGEELSGVSSDGRMAFSNNTTTPNSFPTPRKLYVQPLRPDGLPTGTPVVSAKGDVPLASDISTPLTNGSRLLAFFDFQKGMIFVQPVDAATGKKLVGTPYPIVTDGGQQTQTIAIDPKGRFVVYIDSASCDGEVKFQALDATGHASGTPKTIVSCSDTKFADVGLDIALAQ
jgi:hypothetical protein